MEKYPNSYYYWKLRCKLRENIQLGDPKIANYNHPLIVHLHTVIDKFQILSILEPLDLQSISSRIVVNLWIFTWHSGVKVHVMYYSLFVLPCSLQHSHDINKWWICLQRMSARIKDSPLWCACPHIKFQTTTLIMFLHFKFKD